MRKRGSLEYEDYFAGGVVFEYAAEKFSFDIEPPTKGRGLLRNIQGTPLVWATIHQRIATDPCLCSLQLRALVVSRV
jgi:hypothetical protein